MSDLVGLIAENIPCAADILIVVGAVLHAVFAVAEMLPWGNPKLLRSASKALPDLDPSVTDGESGRKFTGSQQQLVGTIVHNAGIYNAIVSGGLIWAFVRGDVANEVAFVLLCGVAVVGAFGYATMKSKVILGQMIVGLIGALAVGLQQFVFSG